MKEFQWKGCEQDMMSHVRHPAKMLSWLGSANGYLTLACSPNQASAHAGCYWALPQVIKKERVKTIFPNAGFIFWLQRGTTATACIWCSLLWAEFFPFCCGIWETNGLEKKNYMLTASYPRFPWGRFLLSLTRVVWFIASSLQSMFLGYSVTK